MMKVIVLLLFSTMICLSYCQNHEAQQRQLYADLSLDYFITRKIQNVVMFLCWPTTDRNNMIKLYSKNFIRVSITNGKYPTRKKEIDDLFRVYTGLMGVVFDSCCYNTHLPFIQKYAYFNSSYVWLTFDCGFFNGAIDYLNTLPLQINSDHVLTNITANYTDVDLYDLYHTGFGRGGQFKTSLIGRWTNDADDNDVREWIKFFTIPKVNRRFDLYGMAIKTETLVENNKNHLDTHTYLMDDLHPYTDSISKMNYQLIKILQKMYNFTIKFVIANNWSDKNSKGLYQSGNLLGILAEKKADIMAAAVQLMIDRAAITDVIYSTYPFRCGFIFRYSGDFGNVRTSFFSPFNNNVWYCFLFIIILVVLIIWCILSFENKYIKGINKTFWNLSDTILSVIGAICQMGSEVTPVTSASRIVYFIFFFTSLVIYNFYTSSIVSSLLNFRTQTFNIIDLANSPLTCGSIDVGYVHNLLFDIEVSTNPTMDYFNARKITKNFYYTIQDGVEMVKQGGFAYNAEFNSVYKLIENTFEASEICELQEIDTIPGNKLAILGMKHSQYTEMFKVGLNKAAETGQLHRLLFKWVSRKPACQASKSFTEVGLNQIVSSHVLLYVGIGLSIGLVLIERKRRVWLSNENSKIRKLKLLK